MSVSIFRTIHKVQVNVGRLADMGKRFAHVWNQAVVGHQVEETHVTFLNVQTMLDTLSARRLELLRHVRRYGASRTRALALSLGRDYKNVHQDVAVLESTGLLLREGRKVSAPWDELQVIAAGVLTGSGRS